MKNPFNQCRSLDEARELLGNLMVTHKNNDQKLLDINLQFDQFALEHDDEDNYPECNHPPIEDITELPF